MDIKDPRIDTYLNGEMTSEEMSQFEVEAKQFPTVWEHIQFQQFMIEGIRKEGAAELKDFIANRITEEEEEKITRRNIGWSLAATLVILAVGLGISYKSKWENSEVFLFPNAKQKAQGKDQEELKSEPSTGIAKQSVPYRSADSTFIPMIVEEDASDINNSVASSPDDVANRDDQENVLKEGMADEDVPQPYDKGYRVQVAPFVVSAINLNSFTQGDVTQSKTNINGGSGKNKSKSRPSAVASSSLSDTVATLSSGNVAPLSMNGNQTEIKSAESVQRKKFKSERNQQFLITLSEQTGYTKPYAFIGGQTEGVINLTLWNAGTNDVLIYQLSGVYYIELGNFFYYLPLAQGTTTALVKVSNPRLLEQLKQ